MVFLWTFVSFLLCLGLFVLSLAYLCWVLFLFLSLLVLFVYLKERNQNIELGG